jgi:hypothetical protein
MTPVETRGFAVTAGVRSAADAEADGIMLLATVTLDCMAARRGFWADVTVCALSIRGDTTRAAAIRWRMHILQMGKSTRHHHISSSIRLSKKKYQDLLRIYFH